MPRAHSRLSFFKYMTADTAIAVLANKTLRWSSPLLFNDPFDVPRELSFGVSPSQIMRALAERIPQLLHAPPPDTSVLERKVRLLVDMVKQNGISTEKLAELSASLQDFAENYQPTSASIDEFRKMWRQLLPELRILCLTESPAHTSMWYHYADRYAGVVLELRCSEMTDSPWLIARKVEYSENKPDVYTADGWAELLTLEKEISVRRILDAATYTKTMDWSYEKEWRIVSFRRLGDTGEYTDYSFHVDDLASVYLGPLISAPDREAILKGLTSFPLAKAYSVSLSLSREFVFSEIRGE